MNKETRQDKLSKDKLKACKCMGMRLRINSNDRKREELTSYTAKFGKDRAVSYSKRIFIL